VRSDVYAFWVASGRIHTPIGAHDVNVRVDGQVLSIPAADVDPDRAVRELLEESLDDGPWL